MMPRYWSQEKVQAERESRGLTTHGTPRKNKRWKLKGEGIPYLRSDSRYWYDWRYRKTYGITLEQYDEMFRQQGGACAVCGSVPKKNRLSVDHDHATGKVRGLLCMNCNIALERVGKLQAYLKRFEV